MSDFCYGAALRLQINRERVAESFLPRFGFDTFYVPRARTFHVRYNRRIEIHRPFLPGYGFVLITLQWHSLKTCPGVIGPVRDGGPQGQPARVPEDVIAAIRARERDGAIDPPKDAQRPAGAAGGRQDPHQGRPVRRPYWLGRPHRAAPWRDSFHLEWAAPGRAQKRRRGGRMVNRQEECCPHCRRPLGLPELAAVTGSIRRRLVEIVARRSPAGITRAELVDQLYQADPNGGPEWADASVAVIIFKANKQLRAQGCRIVSSGGPGARYRLEKFADQPEAAANAARPNGGAARPD